MILRVHKFSNVCANILKVGGFYSDYKVVSVTKMEGDFLIMINWQ